MFLFSTNANLRDFWRHPNSRFRCALRASPLIDRVLPSTRTERRSKDMLPTI
jgi:hypothetical protein